MATETGELKDEAYYMSLDKRTNEYKDWKSKGLGDTIEKITKATGIKKVVEALVKDCGCTERKEWLNQAVPYPFFNKEPNCMTPEQYDAYKEFKESFDPVQFTIEQQQFVHSLYNSIFATNVKMCANCNHAQWIAFISRLDKVYELNSNK